MGSRWVDACMCAGREEWEVERRGKGRGREGKEGDIKPGVPRIWHLPTNLLGVLRSIYLMSQI